MSVGVWTTIVFVAVIAFIVGIGYFGIHIAKVNPNFKKFSNKKNTIIISLGYIIVVSFISGKNVAYGIGYFISPFLISIINSLFRNKFKFNKTFDEKFYPFLLGVLFFGLVSTTFSAIF